MKSNEETEEGGVMSCRFLRFLVLGVIMVFVGITILFIASVVSGGSGSIGGIILIGPVPIIFGAGPNSGWLIVVGIILTVISVVLFLIMNRHSRKFYA
jgi:uncharacterized membrane protein